MGAPLPHPLSTLSTSTSCQSSLPCHPSSAHPNAPLGAGLCIFNKFRESSKPAISAGGCRRRRLFGCLANGVLAFIYVRGVRNSPRPPRHPPLVPSLLPFLFFLFPFLPSLPSAFEQLAFHRPPTQPPYLSSATLFHPLRSLVPSLAPLFPSSRLSFPRFISSRCQFEFGTRPTGQRVSTKNQFLNSRLFRAKGRGPGTTVPLFFFFFSLLRRDYFPPSWSIQHFATRPSILTR